MAGVKGRGGRPRLPTAIKKARGTLQRCRAPKDEPRIVPKRPPAPSGLDALERKAFDEWADALLDLGVLSLEDGPALRDLACADVRVVRARRIAKKKGMVQVDLKTRKSSPSGYAKELNAARADFSRMLASFGATPSDRSRVKAAPADEKPKAPTAADARRSRMFGA